MDAREPDAISAPVFDLAVFFARLNDGRNLVFWTAEGGDWSMTRGVHCRRVDQEHVQIYVNNLGVGGMESIGDWRS